MTTTPSYQECPVPKTLSPFFSRILHLQYNDKEPALIPARPTGRMYIGWIPKGNATAFANGVDYAFAGGQAHISGQLTVFDVVYTVTADLSHYLAEFTPLGAYQYIGKNLSQYTNKCEIFTPAISGTNSLDTFEQFLHNYTKSVSHVDSKIIEAVNKIDASHGDISISMLSESLGMSGRHLRREFMKYLGIAPKPYALIQKVLFALRMYAKNPQVDISDIVHSAGFYDQAHLIKAFQLYLRSSPKQLRLNDDGVLQSIVVGT